MKNIRYLIGSVIFLCLLYIAGVVYYKSHFLPNSYINQVSVRNLTAMDSLSKVKSCIKTYGIKIVEKDDRKEYIHGTEIDFDIYIDTETLLLKQSLMIWPLAFFKKMEHVSTPIVKFNEELLYSKIDSLNCIKNGEEPQDAYISEYVENKGYEIIEENKGSSVDKELFYQILSDKINNMEEEFDLVKEDCFVKAKITIENEDLIGKVNQLNNSLKANIVYEFGENTITLDANTYHTWIIERDDGFAIDENAITEFVNSLSASTNTAYTKRDFTTSSGNTVQVQGPFGYQIDKASEIEQIKREIESGTKIVRKPNYVLEGSTRIGNDYGDTYVEIDLTNQKVYLYVGGEQIASSYCVTGNVSKGHTTPPGIFPLTYKQKGAVLRGPGYESPVKFWMPFNGGIGLHDASWRSTFGGNIYKTNGSHGCINLPYDMAKTLYEYVYQGMPVICYNGQE